MIRIFIYSSVLFSAAFSASSGSREIIFMAIWEEVSLAVSEYVLEETKRNILRKSPQAIEIVEYLLTQVTFEIVKPTKREVLSAGKYVELKEAPVVAAAKKAKADYLVTLDRKHLLDKPEVATYAGMPIVTPQEALSFLLKKDELIFHGHSQERELQAVV